MSDQWLPPFVIVDDAGKPVGTIEVASQVFGCLKACSVNRRQNKLATGQTTVLLVYLLKRLRLLFCVQQNMSMHGCGLELMYFWPAGRRCCCNF